MIRIKNHELRIKGFLWIFFVFLFLFIIHNSPIIHLVSAQTCDDLYYLDTNVNQCIHKLANDPPICTYAFVPVDRSLCGTCDDLYYLDTNVNQCIHKLANDPPICTYAFVPVDRSLCGSSGGTFDYGPNAAGLKQIRDMFRNVIAVVVALAFVALFIMLVLAGFKYLRSGGEPKALHAAHQTVTWAILGIIFMAIAWLVLQLISVLTGLPVTIFNLGI